MAVLFGKGHFTLESHCPSAAAIWTYLSSLYYFDHLNELNKPDLVYLFLWLMDILVQSRRGHKNRLQTSCSYLFIWLNFEKLKFQIINKYFLCPILLAMRFPLMKFNCLISQHLRLRNLTFHAHYRYFLLTIILSGRKMAFLGIPFLLLANPVLWRLFCQKVYLCAFFRHGAIGRGHAHYPSIYTPSRFALAKRK